MVKTVALIILLIASTPLMVGPIYYSDMFAEYYPEIVNQPNPLMGKVPLEAPLTVPSLYSSHKATLIRTDGTKVSYGESLGNITIELEGGRKQYISLRRFRTVQIRWINDRLLYIGCDIGHMAGVDAIFDVVENRWIYRESIQFLKSE